MRATANALDPLVMLATGVYAQPGVYAMLLGSGVSTAAGIPTGWGVVKELVRRAAAAQDPDDPNAGPEAVDTDESIELWWGQHGDSEPLGYSNLLASLAPTPAARRALLAGFFEPTEDDADAGLKVPTPAHRAIASLAKRGYVRVILTTNFDRLMERALEEAGVLPQVLSRPEAAGTITPLPHASVTVVKLHGDYADLLMRNTVDELGEYPEEWNALLARIFDEYGLVISGWSAESDTALVAAMEEIASRRYPLYWDRRSGKGEAANRVLALHKGVIIPAVSADELFDGLLARLDALERLAEAPLTTAMAVAQLKRYLADPARRIDLHDVVGREVDRTAAAIAAQPRSIEGLTAADLERVTAEHLASVEPLLRLVTTGVYYDRDRQHTDLWVGSLQRLMIARGRWQNGERVQDLLDRLRHYPAMLLMRAAGIVAVSQGRDDVLLRLLRVPSWRDPNLSNTKIPAAMALHDFRVFDQEQLLAYPRFTTRWHYPISLLLRQDLRGVLTDLIPDEEEYAAANDAYEYRVALAQHRMQDLPAAYRGAPGLYIGENKWEWDGSRRPYTEVEFQAVADQADDDWPWWQVLGGRGAAGSDATLGRLREELRAMRRMH